MKFYVLKFYVQINPKSNVIVNRSLPSISRTLVHSKPHDGTLLPQGWSGYRWQRNVSEAAGGKSELRRATVLANGQEAQAYGQCNRK